MKFFMIVALGILAIMSTHGESPKEYHEQYVYEVEQGDTLWSIVKEQYGESVDAREIIYQIKQDNNINGVIHEGQKIVLKK